MGRSYANITVKGRTKDKLVVYLKQLNTNAYVSPTVDNFTVVYDRDIELYIEQFDLANQISTDFNCSTLAVYIYDESVFHYELYKSGKLLDEYISNSTLVNSDMGSFPDGGDAQKLCTALGVKQVTNKVRPILRTPSTDEIYLLASLRHRKLAQTLRLPIWSTDAVGGYRDIEEEVINAVVFDEDDFPDLEATLSMLRKTFD